MSTAVRSDDVVRLAVARKSLPRLVGCVADDRRDGVEHPNPGIDRQLLLAEKTLRNNVTALLARPEPQPDQH